MGKNKTGKKATRKSKAITRKPRAFVIASAGIASSMDFANLMSALMSDIIEGRVTPSTGNAACNAAGKLLKIVEMQYKFGTVKNGDFTKSLALSNVTKPPIVSASH